MTNTLSLMPAACPSFDSGPGLYSDHMLSELLASHEERIRQLRRERLEVDVIANFLTGEIDQHEKAAALLRAQSGNLSAETTNDGVIIITSENSPPAKKSPATRRPGASAHYFTRAQ